MYEYIYSCFDMLWNLFFLKRTTAPEFPRSSYSLQNTIDVSVSLHWMIDCCERLGSADLITFKEFFGVKIIFRLCVSDSEDRSAKVVISPVYYFVQLSNTLSCLEILIIRD